MQLPTRAAEALVAIPQVQRQGQHWRRRQAAPAAAARKQAKQAGGRGFGKAAAPAEQESAELSAEQQAAAAVQAPSPSSSSSTEEEAVAGAPPAAAAGSSSHSSLSSSAELPAVDRGRIFAVCAQVSVLVAAFGFGLRQVAPAISPAVGDGYGERVEALLNWATLPNTSQLALAVAVAAAVTAARAALLSAWPDFREASDRSNQQVLAPLGLADLLWVGGLPAISEELLFRGALIPAIYPDWRGVLIAGLAFGVLHNNGGRNPAFAGWASAVGCAYGALFLATGSVACPALAHALANVASGALWKAARGADETLRGGSSGGGSAA